MALTNIASPSAVEPSAQRTADIAKAAADRRSGAAAGSLHHGHHSHGAAAKTDPAEKAAAPATGLDITV